MSNSPSITGLLRLYQQGDPSALERLLPLVYDELRRLAGKQVGFGKRVSLQPTELVHEAFLRLQGAEGLQINDRAHFFAVACQAMRWVLRDQGRQQTREKRGGTSVRVSFEEELHGVGRADFETDGAVLSDLFEALEARDRRAGQVAQLRAIAGLEVAEIAAALGISEATVKRDWRVARAWILKELGVARAVGE